ncbi:MAG: hypothetical protein N3D85_01920 [Candidatus Bathyarchaeota archaeon]|nr:hypothetical protein [Candidatus Bathyarchaeota archaeon]
MSQNLVIQTVPKQQDQSGLLSLDMQGVDNLFPGFSIGDFAIIHSTQSAVSLTSLLCVRAQLKNGLNSNVVFVDGGNTYNPALLIRFAKIHNLNPDQALKRLSIQKASSAYQLTMFIMEHLEELVKRVSAKLVVISDIAGLFLDEQIAEEEARSVFNQLVCYLQSFAREHKVIVIATYVLRPSIRRSSLLHTLACIKANVVVGLRLTPYEHNFELEKHPRYMLGCAEFSLGHMTLMNFI